MIFLGKKKRVLKGKDKFPLRLVDYLNFTYDNIVTI